MKKFKEIIIGTNNSGKFKEIRALLPKSLKKRSPKELKILSPRETGLTFKANSKIKARFFSKKSGLICISDDSGLEINLLSGAPGIYSSRWAGPNGDFNLAIDKVFKQLKKKKISWENYKNILARFVCCITIGFPNGKTISKTGYVKGRIINIKKGKKGFGYDPIFIPNGYNKTFGEMSHKLKYKIDHRAKAFSKIRNLIF